MLTNLGQALSKAPPMQLAAAYVMVPKELMQSAVQGAVRYMINQLAFADKVQSLSCANYMSCCWVQARFRLASALHSRFFSLHNHPHTHDTTPPDFEHPNTIPTTQDHPLRPFKHT